MLSCVSCVNLHPLYFVRKLPPALPVDFASRCDEAILSSITDYLGFPPDCPSHPSHAATAIQLRLGVKQGGTCLTAMSLIQHSSFYAASVAALHCTGSTTLNRYIDRKLLSVSNPTSSDHSFLRSFEDCRAVLVAGGAVKHEDAPPPPRTRQQNQTPTRPASRCHSASPRPTPPRTPPQISPQHTLTTLLQVHNPACSTAPIHALSPSAVARLTLPFHSPSPLTPPSKPSNHSVLRPLLSGTQPLPQSFLSWLRAMPGSKLHDCFSKPQSVTFLCFALGLTIPALPHSRAAPPQCLCGAPFDEVGHHKLACKLGFAVAQRVDMIVSSTACRACAVPVTCRAKHPRRPFLLTTRTP
mmetsp:Transcript_33233/g.80526  ORF Transcript_33233/g.80526 Transcript_33233/m.80526 type:complete len:355 (-) Transcript_33233:233-1297(-)